MITMHRTTLKGNDVDKGHEVMHSHFHRGKSIKGKGAKVFRKSPSEKLDRRKKWKMVE